MDDETRARVEERLRLLRTTAMVPDKLPELIALLERRSPDEDPEDAADEIAELFGCDHDGGIQVLSTLLRHLHPNARRKLARSIEDLTTQLDGGTI